MRATIEQSHRSNRRATDRHARPRVVEPRIVISYLGPNFDNGECWYVSLTEYKEDRHAPPGYPVKSVIFRASTRRCAKGSRPRLSS